MTALNTLRFSGYTLRPAVRKDWRRAVQWTAADPDHAGKINPEFWLEQRPGMDSVMVEDSQGPVFFFKTQLLITKEKRITAQVFIQFMPRETVEDGNRTRQALTEGMAWLEPVLQQSGAEEIFFTSRQLKLIAFCQKRLGFIVDGKSLEGGYVRLHKTLEPERRAGKTEGVCYVCQ